MVMTFLSDNYISISIGFGVALIIGVYFYTKKPIEENFSSVKIEDFHQYLPSVKLNDFRQYLPSITDAEYAKFIKLLKTDSLAYKLLQDYLKERESISVPLNSNLNLSVTERNALISDLLSGSKEWWALFNHFLKIFNEMPAIWISEFEIPEETIISGVIETDVVETDVIDIKSKFSTTNTNWSTNFSEFFTSEFGIKCLIAGSVVTLTLIVGHLVIKYYFKTTYKAIFIALKKIIVKISIAIKNWLYNILF